MMNVYCKLRHLLLNTLLLFGAGTAFAQTTYYVNDNSMANGIFTTAVGNNGNSGTLPSAPKATISAAMALAQAGDRIMVDAGTYFVTSLTIKAGVKLVGAGPEDNKTVLRIQSPDPIVVSSDAELWNCQIYRALPASSGGAPTISVSNASGSNNARIENCYFYKNRTAIYLNAGTNTKVVRNKFEDNRTGILVDVFGNTNHLNLIIRDNEIKNSRSYGIILLGSEDNSGQSGYVKAKIDNNIITGNLAAGIENNNDNASSEIILRNNWFGAATPEVFAGRSNGLFNVADHDSWGLNNPNFNYNGLPPGDPGFPNGISGANTIGLNVISNATTVPEGAGLTQFVKSNNPPFDFFTNIQDAVNSSSAGAIITLPDGIFREDININKALTVTGTSQTGSIIKGLYYSENGAGDVVNISAANAILSKLTVTRDYGTKDAEWKNATKNQGVIINANNVTVDGILVTGQRNAVYANNKQNISIINNTIDANRTGIHLVNNVSDATVQNNVITNNFTHGIMLNGEGALNISNAKINDNKITGNWYSQLYFHITNTGSAPTATGADLTRNAMGSNVTQSNVAMNEPGYAAQTVSFFGGTSGGSGTTFAGNQMGLELVAVAPWREDVADVSANPGFQPTNIFNVTPVGVPDALNNDYRTIANALGAAYDGATITLDGTFDWGETNAQNSWAKGTDNLLSTVSDNYSAAVKSGINDVILSGTNNATVNGPGDLATANLESFVSFSSSGINKNWEISNLNINGFDLSIYFGSTVSGGADNLKIINNTITVPKDLVADANQNIGIHLSNGKNIEVSNNTFYLAGDGEGTSTSNSTSIAIQSTTSGGDLYDGLKINDNDVIVTGIPHATYPAQVIGFWENSHNVNAAIELKNNTFSNSEVGNLSANNKQLAFRVTSRSGAAKNVVYAFNNITGFKRGIDWIGDPYTSHGQINYAAGSTPVLVQNNKFDNVGFGVTVRKLATSTNTGSPAIINNNSFTNIGDTAVSYLATTGTLDATCNWWEATDLVAIQNAKINAPNGGSIATGMLLVNGGNSAGQGFIPTANCEGVVENVTAGTKHATIQLAIDNANNGNEIRVPAGIYNETVNVNKPLTLKGAKFGMDPRPSVSSSRTINGAGETIVQAVKDQRVFNITAGNVVIDGFQIQQDGGSGTADAVKSDNPQSNLSVINNIVVNATDEAIQLEASDNLLVEQNYIYKSIGDGVAISSYDISPIRGTNQTIRNNDIDSSSSGYASIYLYGTQNVEVVGNVINTKSSGIAIGSGGLPVNNASVHHNKINTELRTAFSALAAGISIEDNGNNIAIANNQIVQIGTFTTAAPALSEKIKYNLIRVGVGATSNPSNVTIQNNYLSRAANEHYIHVLASVTNEVNATCNWIGTSDFNIVPTLVSGSGAINYIPFLNDGTNTLTTGVGFEATANACYAPVHNITKNRDYLTIQSAIDAVTTTNGDIIGVDAGTYVENVNLNGKQLAIRGNNYGINPRLGDWTANSARLPETILEGKLIGTGNGFTIDGFTFKANASGSILSPGSGSGGNIGIKNNLFDGNSLAYNALFSGINATFDIAENVFENFNQGSSFVLMMDGNTLTGSTYTRNLFTNNSRWGMILQGSITTPQLITSNKFDQSATAIILGSGGHSISNNIFSNTGSGIFSQSAGNTITGNAFTNSNIAFTNQAGANNVFTNNSLLGGNGSGLSVVNNDAVNSIAATCNWWGTADGNDIAADITGSVIYAPWLTSGLSSTAQGFTPTGSCDGTPVIMATIVPTNEICGTKGSIEVAWTGGTGDYVVSWTGAASGNQTVTTSPFTVSNLSGGNYTVTVTDANSTSATTAPITVEYHPVLNTNTNTTYATIQSAINAATAGDVVNVCAGTYTETISINKSLTLNGPNAGIDPNTGTRVSEAILQNAGITASAANTTVTIDGFKIYNTQGTTGNLGWHGVNMATGSASSVVATIQNNIFERVGAAAGVNAHGVYLSNSSALKTIKNNLFTGSATYASTGTHRTWRSGVWFNGGSVTIQDNVFERCNTVMNLDAPITNLSVAGNAFKQSGSAITLAGQTAGYFTFGANEFASNVTTLVNNAAVNTGFRLDISAGSYNGTAFSALPLTSLYVVEAKIDHRGKGGSKHGLVYYVKDNIYVTSSTDISVGSTYNIQGAINYAAAEDSITVQNRTSTTYNEYLTIDKPLMLRGQSQANVRLNGASLTGNGSGIKINSGIENVTIEQLTVQGFKGVNGNSHAGIYATGGNNNLNINNVLVQNNTNASGIYANGPVENVTVSNSTINNNTGSSRGIVIWNGLKKNISITNNALSNNGICGIELQDGLATGVTISGNTISGNDNAIGLIGLTSGAGLPKANIIENNTITANGRLGIEIKNPYGTGNDNDTEDGAIIVRNNTITFGSTTDVRDLAGISVYRRGVNLAVNADIPTGVVIKSNTVSGFVQPSTSTGFGIVVEGNNHTVVNNIVTGNDVAVQVQSGHDPASYPAGDGDQSNVADLYFGRGNTPNSCGVFVNNNVDNSSNAVAATYVMANANGGLVLNTNTNKMYCSIQSAINDATTVAGHVIELGNGTFDELVAVNKSVTIKARNGETPTINYSSLTLTGKPTLFDVSKNNVTIEGLTFNVNTALLKSAIIASAPEIDNIIINQNSFTPYGVPASGGYSARNAVSINYDGYANATDGVDNIVFTNNIVHPHAIVGLNSFRAGICADVAGGTFTGNDITSISQDIQVRFGNNGPITITGNQIKGGGVDLASQRASAGPITVNNNTFDGAWWFNLNPGNPIANPMLRLKNNTNGIPTIVSGNTFSDIRWGVSMENYKSVEILNNNFTPLVNATEFRHITVNTKLIAGSALNNITRIAVDAVIKNNIFNGNAVSNAKSKGLAFYNHWNDGTGAQYGNFDVSNNTFNSGMQHYIFIDSLNNVATNDVSVSSPYPEYADNGAAVSTTGYWTKDVVDGNNLYFVGGVAKLYSNMTGFDKFGAGGLEDRIYDKDDKPAIGDVIFGGTVDLMPILFMEENNYSPTVTTNNVIVRVRNLGNLVSGSAIEMTILNPVSGSSLELTPAAISAGWQLIDLFGFGYTLKNVSMPINPNGGSTVVELELTIPAITPIGIRNFEVTLENGTGGDSNNSNNTSQFSIQKFD